jgi:hypothetical protein
VAVCHFLGVVSGCHSLYSLYLFERIIAGLRCLQGVLSLQAARTASAGQPPRGPGVLTYKDGHANAPGGINETEHHITPHHRLAHTHAIGVMSSDGPAADITGDVLVTSQLSR